MGPSGTYSGAKVVLHETASATFTFIGDSALDITIRGDIDADCASEVYVFS